MTVRFLLPGERMPSESTWDESLETGNQLIDDQHRQVVHLLDELRFISEGPEAEVLRVLASVMDFTLVHFSAEELLMSEVEYPAELRDQMIHQHREFTDYARLRIVEFRLGEMQCVGQLHAFLDEWLKVHEFGMDRLLADWIKNRVSAA